MVNNYQNVESQSGGIIRMGTRRENHSDVNRSSFCHSVSNNSVKLSLNIFIKILHITSAHTTNKIKVNQLCAVQQTADE